MAATRRSILTALGAWPCALLAQAPATTGAAAPAATAPTEAATGKASIHPSMEVGDVVAADVVVDGKVLARLDSKATQPGMRKPPALVFPLPSGLKRLQLKGTVTIAGKVSQFNRTWQVRDIAPVSATLYDQSKPWIERVRGLDPALVRPASALSPRQKTATVALQDLEKRLRAPLPEMVRLLAAWDIRPGGHYFLPPADMSTVTEMLLGEWDYTRTGKNGLDELLSAAVRARYDRSLAVFVEVGDGLGALAWDPAGVTPGEPPNTWGDKGNPGAKPGAPNQGVWYWLHQNTLDRPTLLLDDDYRPKTTEAAFTHVLERFWLSSLAKSKDDGVQVVVNTANPRANRLALYFDERNKPRILLRNHDYHYSMY